MEINNVKKLFFASDFHLGAPDAPTSREREMRIIRWLDAIAPQAEALFLVGDIFDFWFEYTSVVPKGYIRLLGRLAAMRDAGIAIHFFVGNHDLWLSDYLVTELGIKLYRVPTDFQFGNKRFHIAHGDGLGPGDGGYKVLKRIFTNPICRWLFRWLHPDIGTRLASFLSRRSRAKQLKKKDVLRSPQSEWLWQYAEQQLTIHPDIDYFVFGHRHLTLDISLTNGHSRYINLGEWLGTRSYAVFDGTELRLEYWEADDSQKIND